ncbi:MAG TPA: extracellular solute-binding protein [Firmicutes bacterium]|nr:extracellular solute-binding protein [Bacillota bacterium]
MRSKKQSKLMVLLSLMTIVLLCSPVLAVELEVWSYTNQKIPQSVIEAFERTHPGVKINQRQPSGDFRTEGLLVAMAAGVPPALTHLNLDFLPMYVENNIVESLTPYVEKGLFGNLDVYFPGVLESVKYKGELYFLPHRMSVNTTLYNRQVFEESGIGGDRPPETWDDFIAIAKKLTILGPNNQVERYGASLQVSTTTTTSWFQPVLFQAGGQWLESRRGDIPIEISEAGKVAFNSDEGRAALNFYAEQLQSRIATEGTNPFRDQKAAMLWQWYSTFVKTWREEGRSWVDVGPILRHKEKVGYGSLAGWVVPKGPHVDLAMELLAFTLRPENVRQFLIETAFLPVRKDIGIDYFGEQHKDWAVKFINEVPYVRFDILHPEIRALQPLVTKSLIKGARGEMPVGAALAEAEQLANAHLKEAGY